MTKAEEYNKTGIEYFSRRDYKTAADYFIKAANEKENNSLYLYNAGNALCRDALEGRKESCAPAMQMPVISWATFIIQGFIRSLSPKI